MEYGELYIEADRPQYNLKTGQFLKGHVPANKGKRWSEWMGKRAMKRCMRGWKNLELYRPQGNGGHNKKKVVAVNDVGSWLIFDSVRKVAEWLGDGSRENVGRCADTMRVAWCAVRERTRGQPIPTTNIRV